MPGSCFEIYNWMDDGCELNNNYAIGIGIFVGITLALSFYLIQRHASKQLIETWTSNRKNTHKSLHESFSKFQDAFVSFEFGNIDDVNAMNLSITERWKEIELIFRFNAMYLDPETSSLINEFMNIDRKNRQKKYCDKSRWADYNEQINEILGKLEPEFVTPPNKIYQIFLKFQSKFKKT